MRHFVNKSSACYKVLDKNSNGRISQAEVGELLKSMGQHHPTEADLRDIMEELDTSRSGGITFTQFLQFMTKYVVINLGLECKSNLNKLILQTIRCKKYKHGIEGSI